MKVELQVRGFLDTRVFGALVICRCKNNKSILLHYEDSDRDRVRFSGVLPQFLPIMVVIFDGFKAEFRGSGNFAFARKTKYQSFRLMGFQLARLATFEPEYGSSDDSHGSCDKKQLGFLNLGVH